MKNQITKLVLEMLEKLKSIAYDCLSSSDGGGFVRLAICDDETVIRTGLIDIIQKTCLLTADSEIVEFSGGTALIDSHLMNPFDIIFLDIEMKDKTGLETGHEIREKDKNVIIIFITSHQQYVYQSFMVEPFDYIVKPADEAVISNVLQRALTKHRERHHLITFRWEGVTQTCDVSDLVSIEGYKRRVVFKTKDNQLECNGSLNDYEQRLTPYGFIRCHRETLINLNYVKSIEQSRIITVFNDIVEMSARRKQHCKKAFDKFLIKYKV